MTVVVIGATGFVGTSLRRELQAAGHRVIAVARRVPGTAASEPRTTWVTLDLGEPHARLDYAGDVDALVYLAQSSFYRDFPDRAIDMFQVNVNAMLSSLEWARRRHVATFLYASSANVYAPSARAIAETTPVAPSSFYGQTKQIAEIVLSAYAEYFRCIAFRLFSVYGPGQRDKLIPSLIARVESGDPIEVQGPSGGLKLSPLHVSDVVRCIRAALESEASSAGYHLLNVGGPETLSLRDIGEAIGDALGRPATFRVTAGPDPGGYVADNSLLRQRLGIMPNVTFREGLRTMLHAATRHD